MENGPDIKIRLPFAYVAPSSPLREATAQSKGWEIRMHKISCLAVMCSPNIGPFIYWGLSSRQPGSELGSSGGDPRKGRRERGKEARCFLETVFKEIMFFVFVISESRCRWDSFTWCVSSFSYQYIMLSLHWALFATLAMPDWWLGLGFQMTVQHMLPSHFSLQYI